MAAHLREHVREAKVSLPGDLADTLDPNSRSCQRRGRKEIAGRRSVPLNKVVTRLVPLPGIDVVDKLSIAFVIMNVDPDPEILHRPEGQVQVGRGEHLPHQANFDVLLRHGRHHQHGGDKLARGVAGHIDPPSLQHPGTDRHRRTSGRTADLSSKIPERLNQLIDRTLPHPLISIDHVIPAGDGQDSGQKTGGRTGVPQAEGSLLIRIAIQIAPDRKGKSIP